MPTLRLALAALTTPADPDASVTAACDAIADAARAGADLLCLPEAFVPGYRVLNGTPVPAGHREWLDQAHERVAWAAGEHRITVVLGTERYARDDLRLAALVLDPAGRVLAWQDKVQLDPTEDVIYAPGAGRSVFTVGEATVGVVICHEGWRYPETVRAAVRAGAQVVLHPHFAPPEPTGPLLGEFGDPRGGFHEGAARARAAENTCWFASVNCAGDDTTITSAVIRPDGTVHAAQPRGVPGLLIADLDLTLATRALATRFRP